MKTCLHKLQHFKKSFDLTLVTRNPLLRLFLFGFFFFLFVCRRLLSSLAFFFFLNKTHAKDASDTLEYQDARLQRSYIYNRGSWWGGSLHRYSQEYRFGNFILEIRFRFYFFINSNSFSSFF